MEYKHNLDCKSMLYRSTVNDRQTGKSTVSRAFYRWKDYAKRRVNWAWHFYKHWVTATACTKCVVTLLIHCCLPRWFAGRVVSAHYKSSRGVVAQQAYVLLQKAYQLQATDPTWGSSVISFGYERACSAQLLILE